jgi:hypothetical protein
VAHIDDAVVAEFEASHHAVNQPAVAPRSLRRQARFRR